jgi:hypothetical protein
VPTDPRDLAARPAFAQFLAALKGGEGPCPRCGGRGRLGSEDPDWPGPHPELGPLPVECPRCGGSGRVAVPPDLTVAGMLHDWWLEQGGDVRGLLAVLDEEVGFNAATAWLWQWCKMSEPAGR